MATVQLGDGVDGACGLDDEIVLDGGGRDGR